MFSTNNIILNSSNLVNNTYNNIYKYNFINGGYAVAENSQMCVSSIVLPYSNFNVSAGYYNNASFQYIWSGTTYTVTFPDGFYQISDINNYIEQYMLSQNQYLIITATGQYYYFISLLTNITYYTNQFILYPIPTALPAGFTAPVGFVYSASGYTPQIKILSTNKFGNLIGYTAGNYPTTITVNSTSILGNTTPNLTPVNSFVITCNIINNSTSFPTNVLDTFSPNTTFGSNITYTPYQSKWINTKKGRYTQLIITLVDQNFNNIKFNDINLLITLIIRHPEEIKQHIPREIQTPISDILNEKEKKI
jgi:hypothetical protein